MSDWVRWALMAAGSVMVVWSGVQSQLSTQDYRLERVEKTLETHLMKHDVQYEAIQKSLNQIQVDLARHRE